MILNNVTTICASSFASQTSIKHVSFENNCALTKKIESSAFIKCSNLETIDIPYSTTLIGANAFYFCINLVNINFPVLLASIEKPTFMGCTKLETISFTDLENPSGKLAIGEKCF